MVIVGSNYREPIDGQSANETAINILTVMDKNIKPYFVKEKGAGWSVLSFHYNKQRAKVLASQDWLTDFEYISLRVVRADDDYMLFAKLDEPHVVDSWPYEINRFLDNRDSPTWAQALEKKKELQTIKNKLGKTNNIMKVKKITSVHGNDFSAIMKCEHCGNEQKITTGYNDANYKNNVIPAMTCKKCGKNRSGEIPDIKNDYGMKPV